MKRYLVKNVGCDDTTEFEIDLNDEELKVVVRLFELNNKSVVDGCMPELYIYEENKKVPINKILVGFKYNDFHIRF